MQEKLVIVTGGYNGLGGFNVLKSTEILVDSKTWIDGSLTNTIGTYCAWVV